MGRERDPIGETPGLSRRKLRKRRNRFTLDEVTYTARHYRPRAEILNGTWKFPETQPVEAGSRGVAVKAWHERLLRVQKRTWGNVVAGRPQPDGSGLSNCAECSRSLKRGRFARFLGQPVYL